MADRLRMGLIGAGRRGQAHLGSIAGMPDLFEMVGVCDVNELNLRAAAQRFEVDVYADLDDFYTGARPQIVVITTPAESHHVMVATAAQRGVHVFVETPLAPTRAMMDSIQQTADRTGVKIEVGENFWRQPIHRLNRAALEAGLIGRVLRVTCSYEMGGNREMYYHAMSLLRYYGGGGSAGAEVRAFETRSEVEAGLDDSGRPMNPEIWNQAIVSFANGVQGLNTQISTAGLPQRRSHPRFLSLEGSTGLIVSGRRVASGLHRAENEAEVVYPLQIERGEQDGKPTLARYFYQTQPPVEFANPVTRWPYPYGESPFGMEDDVARAAELWSFHQAALGQPVAYAVVEARQDQELSIGVNESARLGGQPVRLPLGPETPWERAQHEAFRDRWGCDPFGDPREIAHKNFGTRGFV